MRDLGELPLEDAAKQAAGNWRQFSCFCVAARLTTLTEAGKTGRLCTPTTGTSGLLDREQRQSRSTKRWHRSSKGADNSDPDVVEENHTHWAVGWIDGLFSIRVYKRGRITKAVQASTTR